MFFFKMFLDSGNFLCKYLYKGKIMARRLTKEEFIEKANAKHDSKFDYSKVEYRNYRTNIIVICPSHGEVTTTPEKHLEYCGCWQCGVELRAKNRAKNPNTGCMSKLR